VSRRRYESINPTRRDRRKKPLAEGADTVFGKRLSSKANLAECDPHEREMNRMRAVISEITTESRKPQKHPFPLLSANPHRLA
tara:strand:+ start:4920 stop:5168 length:249 start_codon:yes stop_codon:yes gene_type:complete